MKKIIQDLSYAEIEELVLALGEKKFRAKQLYEGLTQGKKISDISLKNGFVRSLKMKRCALKNAFFLRTERKNTYLNMPTETLSKGC